MCWSAEASVSIALIGYAVTYSEYRKMRKHQQPWSEQYGLRGIATFYLSLMETLQAVNYTVIDTAGFWNSFYSLLGYVHISFQPLFVSLFCLSFIPKKRRVYWMKYALFFSMLSAVVFLSRLVISPSLPGCFSRHCSPVISMDSLLSLNVFFTKTVGCAKTSFLSYPGDWHIAWQWVLNNCSALEYAYFFTVFVLPCCYGAYLCVLSFALCGPIAAIFLSNNPDEFAAIWCLITMGFVGSLKIPIWNRMITVQHESWRDAWHSMHRRLNQWHRRFHAEQ